MQIFKFLFSRQLTVVLLAVFGITMAYATFIENDFGTKAVRALIYDSWWFESIMVILSINFIGNIWNYRLWQKGKWPVLFFHVGFIITILGAFITRYFGQEGMMHIRENDRSNKIISEERFLTVEVKKGSYQTYLQEEIRATAITQPDIDLTFGEGAKTFTLKSKRFVPDAVQTMVHGESDEIVLEVVISHEGERKDLFLVSGKTLKLPHSKLTFNNPEPGAFNILQFGDSLVLSSPHDLGYLRMADQQAGQVQAGDTSALLIRTLYRAGDVSFVISQRHDGMKTQYIPAQDEDMAKAASDLWLVTLADNDGNVKELEMAALDGVYSMPKEFEFSGYDVSANYGPRLIELPFSLFLRDFQLERYPGSTSPSSYASEITVEDADGSFPYRIFMNNVLDHGGYRFFQASYDLDELGTVLSVNRDFWGTQITYFGYFILFGGMIWTLFGKQSRFQFVLRKLKGINAKQAAAFIAILLMANVSKAQSDSTIVIDSAHIIPKTHTELFGRLLVQDIDGRIKPINTLSSEFTRKLYRSTQLSNPTVTGEKLNPDQVFLSLQMDPQYWSEIPLIKVDKKEGSLILEKVWKKGADKVSFINLFDENGNYHLTEWVEEANRKKPAERSSFDKEVLKVDERFNILFQAMNGYYLKIFPKKDDPNNTWFDYNIAGGGFNAEDSTFVTGILPLYFSSVNAAIKSGDWAEADQRLSYIKTYQNIIGKEVIPSTNRQKAELLYNELNIFNRLFGFYWLIGLLMLVMVIVKVFNEHKAVNLTITVLFWITAVLFALQTFNIILRWYAGDYPPWSNGYEMIILVSWFIMLFGLIFHRSSDFVLPLSSLFTGTLLFVSFLDWLNPEITNLVPVLKSYWLKIHVAVIVGSYAPLALSALLGLMALVIMLFPKHTKLQAKTHELTCINELSMTIGIVMLTIGTFLGGIWANESWGRYWGWDPKETWALISVLVYAIVLHLRLIPSLRSQYIFNVASLFAFYSIIMTSFGVNYYLSGLHSYAKGDPLPIPTFVYWLTGSLIFITVLAYFQKRKSSLPATT